ncbi:MAG: bifunctional phosphoglucose/phosphomannose isomerase [Nanoarchaeota archaeon]
MTKPLEFPDDYYVHDKAHMKDVMDSFSKYVKDGWRLGESITVEGAVTRVMLCGMGGSAIAGDLVASYLSDKKIQIEVSRDYDIPKSCDENTLFFCCSYSGNTEETISAYRQAARVGKRIVVMTSGGRLEELSKVNRHQTIMLPKGLQPRAAVHLQFFAMLRVLQTAGVVKEQEKEIERLIGHIDIPTLSKNAISLSEKLVDKVPIIYASQRYLPMAYRFKTQLNENAKVMAYASAIPEMCHNELVGYTRQRESFVAIIFKTDDDHRRTMKRMDLVKGIIRKAGVEAIEISIRGAPLNKIFSAVLIGDYISYYLALRYKIDPSPVVLIEKFKKDMGPFI